MVGQLTERDAAVAVPFLEDLTALRCLDIRHDGAGVNLDRIVRFVKRPEGEELVAVSVLALLAFSFLLTVSPFVV